jgi:simple sugar transport system substrate-binding protein
MKKYVMRGLILLACAAVLALLPAGCSAKAEQGVKYLVGVSQANMRDPWRLVLTREIREEAAKHSEIRVIFTDATQDGEKQIKDIERLLGYGIDLLIVSPCDSEKITPVVSEVYLEQSIPVIVLDRAVEGFDYTLFIGPDNYEIGKLAGESVYDMFGDSPGKILELSANMETQASVERSAGFESAISQYPSLSARRLVAEDNTRDSAEDLLAGSGGSLRDVDVIFAHNDYMALGAYKAVSKLGYKPRIIGIDGFTGPDDGLELIRKGMIDKTVTASTGGREAVKYALDILNKASGVPKQIILRSHIITPDNVDSYEEMLNREPTNAGRVINVGYSQLGAESAWRLANTESIKEAAREFGINLIYDEADQSQARQIEALRGFIEYGVDAIVLSPVVETGWDEVLREAKAAGIPVILSDRKVQIEPKEELFETYLGVDAVEEGRRAMRWILQQDMELPVRILEIQGTVGASPTLDRGSGFQELLEQHPDYGIVYSQSGDFTKEGGRQVIEAYLNRHMWDIDVIFAHNDDMALGAIDVLAEHGIRPGVDVKIVSIDGAKQAFEAMIAGKLNCVVECTPLLGPQLMKAIQDLMSGKELPLRIITEDKVFTQENAAKEVHNRKY